MIEELLVLCGQHEMGRVLRDHRHGRLSFRYAEDWQSNPTSFPISLSMPLAAMEHGHEAVESFLWGLLPDNEEVLRRWGTKFRVSPKNPFALLWHVGEDCAGAIQFVRSEQVEVWKKCPARGDVLWLSQVDVVERMALLCRDHSAGRAGADSGQFSLAGAQQ